MKIRVFLADDHTVVRDGLRLILETDEDITVVGEAADGRKAVDEVLKLKPAIVIMDIAMPNLNGIEATQQILKTLPAVKVIILSMHASTEYVSRALTAGAVGYLLGICRKGGRQSSQNSLSWPSLPVPEDFRIPH
jgi:two-component system, NarL family, response regulator NreC